MKTQSYIGNPPDDERCYHHRCARCGLSLTWEDCVNCAGEGVIEDGVECDMCDGDGAIAMCIEDEEYCRANPLPGRESVLSHTVEYIATGDDK